MEKIAKAKKEEEEKKGASILKGDLFVFDD